MGLMDKMKAQANQLAERAQEAGKAGQAKIESLQAKRKADALLEELGRITYAAHNAKSAPGDEGRITAIVEQLRQYEAEHGPVGEGSGPDGDGDPSDTSASSGGTGDGGIPSANYGGGEV